MQQNKDSYRENFYVNEVFLSLKVLKRKRFKS